VPGREGADADAVAEDCAAGEENPWSSVWKEGNVGADVTLGSCG